MTKDYSEYNLRSESITGAVVGDHPVVNMHFGGRQGSESLGDLLSLIPAPPEPYIPHTYTLLTSKFVGRQKELNFLTDWVAKPDSEIYENHILCLVAFGGMGKSALTWKWFNDIAPQEMNPLVGRLWWSFYENSSYEEFIICSLAYVLGVSEEKILKELEKVNGNKQQIDRLIAKCESKLLGCLKKQPFLFVLDGLERMLTAYALRDIARVADEDLDEYIEEAITDRDQTSIKQTEEIIKHARRQTTDPRMGRFLKNLVAQSGQSRILVSTRLFPEEWKTGGEAIVGCYQYRLEGLHEDDALTLFRGDDENGDDEKKKVKVKGSRDAIQPFLASFKNYPLLIKLLAGVIREHRRAPGDFDQWRQNNLTFDPFSLDIKQVKSHILKFALQDLDQISRRVLQIIAGFRIPPSYEQLIALLVGEEKPIATEAILEQSLQDLENRGLLGWDREANRYEMHPVVRGAIWSFVTPDDKRSIYLEIQTYIDASLPNDLSEETIKIVAISDLNKLVGSLIEKYDKLIELGEYDQAFLIFNLLNVLDASRLGGCAQKLELLSMFFPQGHTYDSCLSNAKSQARATYLLGDTLIKLGQIEYAASLLQRAAIQYARELDLYNVCETLNQLSYCFLCAGNLRKLEATTRQTLLVARERGYSDQESASLFYMAQGFLLQKRLDVAREVLQRLSLLEPNGRKFYCIASWLAFEEKNYNEAFQYATKEFEVGQYDELNMLMAAKKSGAAAIQLGNFSVAEERLNFALDIARSGNFIEQGVQVQIFLAELRYQQGNFADARALLDEISEAVRRGSLNISYADALNLLAQIEQAAGNELAARNEAIKAFKLAWFNGVPYHYEQGLKDACNYLIKVKDLQLDESSSFEVVRDRLIELRFLQTEDLPLFNETDDEPLEEVEPNLSIATLPGITNTQEWTDEQIVARLEETKQVLDWENTTGSARKWWEAFEDENKHLWWLVLRLTEELRNRKATITEFFLAVTYGNTDNIQANLHYLDYTRLKKEEERRTKEAAREVSSDRDSDSEDSTAVSKLQNSNEDLFASNKSNWGNASRKLIQSLIGTNRNLEPNLSIATLPGITNTQEWTDEQIVARLEETKQVLDWENTTGSARKWWEAFEDENKHRLGLVFRLAEELRNRKATITEFFLAVTYSNTDNIQANLHYLDYTRLNKGQKRTLFTPSGITNTQGWTNEQIVTQLEETKQVLDWENTIGSARKWWEAFENENQHRLALVLRLAEELRNRKATITEFFSTYVYSNADNIQANLHYLDYTRLKKEEERKRREAAREASLDKTNIEESIDLTESPDPNEKVSTPAKLNWGVTFYRLIQNLLGNYSNYMNLKKEEKHSQKEVPREVSLDEAEPEESVDTADCQSPSEINPSTPPGVTNTQGWTNEQIVTQLEETKQVLDWENTIGSTRKWWEAFENENQHRLALVLRLAEELRNRKATITEFSLASTYSNTDNIQANLHYLDFTRLKKEEERRKREATATAQSEQTALEAAIETGSSLEDDDSYLGLLDLEEENGFDSEEVNDSDDFDIDDNYDLDEEDADDEDDSNDFL